MNTQTAIHIRAALAILAVVSLFQVMLSGTQDTIQGIVRVGIGIVGLIALEGMLTRPLFQFARVRASEGNRRS